MTRRPAGILTAAVVLLTLVLEVAFRHLAHPEFLWHSLPGFDFLYGLAGCLGIVLVSKWMGHALIQRPESYYDDPNEPKASERPEGREKGSE